MLRITSTAFFLLFAFAILFISIFRTAVPNYAFSLSPSVRSDNSLVSSQVDYYFPTPGINPESPLWPLKVVRDKLRLFVNFDPEQRSDLLILYADKRLMMAQDLMRDKKGSLAVSTASKAEKYLQEAYLETDNISKEGNDPTSTLQKLAKASLKHHEVLQNMMNGAPDDVKPVLNKISNLSKEIYESINLKLVKMNRPVPSPFPKNTGN